MSLPNNRIIRLFFTSLFSSFFLFFLILNSKSFIPEIYAADWTWGSDGSGNFVIKDRTTGITKFSLDANGAVATSRLSASNLSSGAFGSNTGGGNYTFPASVGIGTTSPGANLDVVGTLTTGTGNFTHRLVHGTNARLLLPAANNGAGSGNVNFVWWASEPGMTWTGAGMARNMYNTTNWPRINGSLSGQMMHFDEGTGIQFTVENAQGTRRTPLSTDISGSYVTGNLIQYSNVTGNITNYSGWTGNAGGFHDVYYDGAVQVHLSAGTASGPSYINNGNVGIGTVSPGTKLDVAGGIQTNGCDSMWGGWCRAINFSNTGHAALAYPTGGLMFGMHSNRNFYWADTTNGWYAMTLGAAGSLNVRGTVTAPTFSGALSGNASSATTATTATNLTGATVNTTTKMTLGLTGKNVTKRNDYTGDTNYWTGSMGWGGTYDWNSIFWQGDGFYDNWGTNMAGAPESGYIHAQGIQVEHYNNGSTGYGWQMMSGHAGNGNWYLRSIWGGGFGSWNKIIHSNSSNPNICTLVSYTGGSGTTSCPAGYYTYSGVGLSSGQLLCCKVSNPI